MADHSLSRRLFMAAAAAPAAPVVLASDRIVIFDPPPARVRIVAATASSVVGPARYTAAEIKQITSQGKDVQIILPANADELNKALPDADVVFGALNAEWLAKAKRLRWLQATEAGMERVLFPELIKSDVVVTNMARMFAPAISETAIAMLLSLTRGLNKFYYPQFQKRTWHAERNLVEVDGMTMGIVGMGGIGQATAMRAHYGFNMRILATDAKPITKPIFVDTLREPAWLMEMVPQVDILVSAAPATKETEAMFNENVFRAMKKTAYFINLSRGALVDENSLAQALKEGWIAGAGLDPARTEPLPSTHPFWDCPNLVITCHSSGFAPQRQIRLIGLLADNVRRYTSGLPLINVVDKQRGY
ncbi:MAG: D-2-hydroxyacid dehydrogenase [Acidobacteriia bacterium]|nr:D-2-hydroxyacid dehydrogenase [Terriglobia bacterium]